MVKVYNNYNNLNKCNLLDNRVSLLNMTIAKIQNFSK